MAEPHESERNPPLLRRRGFLARLAAGLGLAATGALQFGQREEEPSPAPPPAEPAPPPFHEKPHFFPEIHGDPRQAIAHPNLEHVIDLETLLQASGPQHLARPANDRAPGGRRQPFVLSWNAHRIDPAKLLIDNERGVLSYDRRTLMHWDAPKRGWRQDDGGPHLWGGPRAAPSREAILDSLLPPADTALVGHADSLSLADTARAAPPDSSALPQPPETAPPKADSLLPLSAAARRAHPFHHRYVYTPENSKPLRRLLRPGTKTGNFHDLSAPPPEVPDQSFAYAEWKYGHAAKSMWNILHWRPAGDTDYPMKANYAPLAVARIESAHDDLPGPDNWEVNSLGYGGFFQPQINRPYKAALMDAAMVEKDGAWRGVEIDGRAIADREDYRADWKAQMVFFWSYLGTIKRTLKESVGCYRENETARAEACPGEPPRLVHPEMAKQAGISYFSACMGGFLTGPSTAVAYLQEGKNRHDANGTSTEFYMKYFAPITEDLFAVPKTLLNQATQRFITAYFSPEGKPRRIFPAPPLRAPPSDGRERPSRPWSLRVLPPEDMACEDTLLSNSIGRAGTGLHRK